ncbi:MAG: hypothetical protein OEL81_02895 [Nitrosopumilus sp.]|nr:hypothetical protein [Nitrosopumilus sp.]
MLENTQKRDLSNKKIKKFHVKQTKFYDNYEMLFEESLRTAMGQGW